MGKQSKFPRPEVLEREDDKARDLQIALMDCIRKLAELSGVSVRELGLCTGVGIHTVCDKGRNLRLFSLYHLWRFVAKRHNLFLRVHTLLNLLIYCAEHDTVLVAYLHPSDEPLPKGAHFLLSHEPPQG